MVGTESENSDSTVYIYEDETGWAERCAKAFDAHGYEHVNTVFSSLEIQDAEWLSLSGQWFCGYPMPDEDNGYLRSTYSDKDYCLECGVGLVQQSPFQIWRNPRWGQRSITELHWVMDEVFVKPESYDNCFKGFGIEALQVLKFRSDFRLDGVVQLVNVGVAKIETCGLEYVDCQVCGTRKFRQHNRGFQPMVLNSPTKHILKSDQWFGTGREAYKMVLVSHDLHHEIVRHKLKGALFEPCASG